VFILTARSGNLEIMEWLYDNNFPSSPFVFADAADNEYLEIMK
jgi:hypothetical protein